jgi:hypothetical protein
VEDSLVAVYQNSSTAEPDRESRYDRISWPPYRGVAYYSWETKDFPTPWINAGNISTYEHLRRRPSTQTQDLVYHYTSAAALQSIVETNELWLTDFAYLNDASEFVHGRKAVEETLESLSASGEYEKSEAVFGQWLDELRNGPVPRVCVASFSMDGDSLSQWRAYGGIALGFDPTSSFGYMPESQIGVVSYDEADQRDRIGLFAHHHHFAYLQETSDTRQRLAKSMRSLNRLYREIAFFKHRSFADEREVRLVYVEDAELFDKMGMNRARKRYRTSGDQMVPYVTTGDLALRLLAAERERTPLPLKEIVIGPNPRAERIRQGILDFLSEKGYHNVRVRVSDTPFQPHK